MATTTSQKWLLGCGIGCAVIIIAIVGLVTGAVVYVRGRVQPLQQATESNRKLVTAYGAPDAYVPPANGAVSRERMEAFLAIRDSLRDAQAKVDTTLANFDFERLNERHPSFWKVLGFLNDFGNLLTVGGEYVNGRNRALSDNRMGMGEYAYIYSISYHSWLRHVPEEGTEIFSKMRNQEGFRTSDDTPINPDTIRRQYRRLMLSLLRNQLNGIKASEDTNWRHTLEEEIGRMDKNFDRVAWQDNLPARIEEQLKPFRSRLEADYHSSSNCFELLTLNEARQSDWNGVEIRREIRAGRRSAAEPAETPEAAPATPEMPESVSATGGGNIAYVVGGGVKAPVPIQQPAPPYTEQARQARAEGVISLRAVIRKDGTVGNIKVVRGLGYGLDESAVDTVKTKWIFSPGTLGGTPVDVQASIEISFRLK